jgi:hypothetical protein
MYKLQRTDGLADWNMQNQYNAPSQQMERLKAAGLNPNLVYESNPNVASAQVRQSDTGSYKPDIPQVDGGMIANAWINARQAALQRKQTEAQTKSLESQQKLQDAQALESNSRTANNTQDLSLKKSLMQSNIEAAELQNMKMATETQVLKERNAREAVMQSQNIKESVVRIAEMNSRIEKNKYDIENVQTAIQSGKLDNEFKRLENDLAKNGVFKNDPIYARIAVRAYEAIKKDSQKNTNKKDPNVEHSQKWFKNQSPYFMQLIRQAFEGK